MRSKVLGNAAGLAILAGTVTAQQRPAPSTTGAGPGNDVKKVVETMQDNLGMLRA
jgi:hypothetical protein